MKDRGNMIDYLCPLSRACRVEFVKFHPVEIDLVLELFDTNYESNSPPINCISVL